MADFISTIEDDDEVNVIEESSDSDEDVSRPYEIGPIS